MEESKKLEHLLNEVLKSGEAFSKTRFSYLPALRPKVNCDHTIVIDDNPFLKYAIPQLIILNFSPIENAERIKDLMLRIETNCNDEFHYKDIKALIEKPDIEMINEYKHYLECCILSGGPGTSSNNELLLKRITILYNKEIVEVKNKDLHLENRLISSVRKIDNSPHAKYSHKQIAIAYFSMDIQISNKNVDKILRYYPYLKSSATLLKKRISNRNNLIKSSGNKTTDTKHLNDLNAAKRIIIGKKNKDGESFITGVITAFTTAYKNNY